MITSTFSASAMQRLPGLVEKPGMDARSLLSRIATLHAEIAACVAPEHAPPTTDETLADAIDRYLAHIASRGQLPEGHPDRLSPRTVENYRVTAAMLVTKGPRLLRDLDAESMTALLIDLSPSWRNRARCEWTAALRFLGHPVVIDPRLTRRAPRQKLWTAQDYAGAFEALLSGYDRAVASGRRAAVSVAVCSLLVAMTGLRAGEAVTITRADVGRHWLTVHGKTGERRIPLTDAVRELLKGRPSEGPLFPAGPGSSKATLDVHSIAHYIRRTTRRADLPGIHTHWLRHAYASWLVNRGVPLTVVSYLLGHSSPEITAKVYVHPCVEAQHEAAELLTKAITTGRLTKRPTPARRTPHSVTKTFAKRRWS